MKNMHTLIAASLVCVTMGGGAWAQEPYVIKFSADSSSAGDVCQNIIPEWSNAVETASEGRIKVETFCDGTMSKMGDTVDRVASGVAQAGWDLAFAYGARFGVLNVIGLPGLYEDPELASGALWNYYNADTGGLKSTLESQGVKMIWLQAVPNVSFFFTDKLDDNTNLNGRKIAAGNPTRAFMVTEHGGVPIRLGVPDYYNGLSRGVVDATMTTVGAIASYKIDEITDYYLFGSFGGGYTIGVMSLDFYNGLPDDLKKVIDDASGYDFSRWTGKHIFDFETAYMRDEMLTKPGREQHFLTEEELKSWQPTFEAARNAWIEQTENGDVYADSIVGLLAAEAEKHAKN